MKKRMEKVMLFEISSKNARQRSRKKKKRKKILESLSQQTSGAAVHITIHRRYPITIRRGSFCLRCFHSEPVHSSLDNLDTPSYLDVAILTRNLMWTPDQHRTCPTVWFPPTANPKTLSWRSPYRVALPTPAYSTASQLPALSFKTAKTSFLTVQTVAFPVTNKQNNKKL